MVLKGIFAAVLGIGVLAWNGASAAEEYRPDEFLRLDLPRAALSPKPLGPPTQFEPVAVEAKADPAVAATPPRTAKRHGPAQARSAQTKSAQARPAERTRQVRKHGNPLDAQAFDARIQVWPCRSGGICNWQRH
jgi:hypothetical protein